MRSKKIFNLRRPKLRQSWNKHNLYNLARVVGKYDSRPNATFFQQKWSAKARTRAYHGEQVTEKQWVRMFSRRLNSAVDMPAEYLAAHDGSEQGSGRGSGLMTKDAVSAEQYWTHAQPDRRKRISHPFQNFRIDPQQTLQRALTKITPYMQMTYAPLERRLDTAVFRALFASSIRQARQFVIHGAVKVNGKKMVHPQYLLNPGDMFQVEVDKVLYGTGVQKSPAEKKRIPRLLEMAAKRDADAQSKHLAMKAAQQASEGSEKGEVAESTEAAEPTEAAAEGASVAENDEEAVDENSEELTEEDAMQLRSKQLERLLFDVKMVLRDKNQDLTPSKKRKLRVFRSAAARFLSRPDDKQADMVEIMQELQIQMQSLSFLKGDEGKGKGKGRGKDKAASEDAAAEGEEADSEPKHNKEREITKALESVGLSRSEMKKAREIMGHEPLSKEELRKLGWLLRQEAENPVDETKPYATPWRPRPFMRAFAFIPRYLEVNPNICAAVYLRHPVARKGSAEVPTPFDYFSSQLAYNWYLGRG